MLGPKIAPIFRKEQRMAPCGICWVSQGIEVTSKRSLDLLGVGQTSLHPLGKLWESEEVFMVPRTSPAPFCPKPELG